MTSIREFFTSPIVLAMSGRDLHIQATPKMGDL